MLVEIHPPSRRQLSAIDSKFALQRDDWNDYSFQTLYHLYYRNADPKGEPTLIGGVKILRRGQTESDHQLVTQSFDVLDDQFCSVGTSLDYYQRLNSLPTEDRAEIASALRDVCAFPQLQDEFSSEK